MGRAGLVVVVGGVDQEFDFKHSNFEMSIRHLSGEGKNKDDV